MNRLTLSLLLVLLLTFATAAQPTTIDLKGKTLAATFSTLLPEMGTADNGTRTTAQQKWQDLCLRIGAPGNEQLRAEACVLMAAKLDAKTPTTARLWLLTQLERIGREECVDALAALLDGKDDQIRESAVRALANNPSSKATGKLTEELTSATGKAKIGLLNALGHRGDAAAVGAVAKELTGETETSVAAARALGRIPGPAGLKVLTAARGKAKGPVLAAIANALLAHADRMVKDRDVEKAAAIYKLLNTPDEPGAIRLAAIRGTIQTAGDGAGELILEILAGDDRGAQTVAVGQIAYLSASALKSLTDGLDKLPVPGRVLVVTAIAARDDRSQLPVVLSAAKSTNADVRRAGLLALGRLGDVSAVELLLDVISSKDALAGIAAESLARLPAEVVDEKLISVLTKEKNSGRAVALIGILERRKAASAVPTLLTSASGPDAAVRMASFAALKTVATPEHVSGMVKALLRTEKGKEREQAELAIVATCSQIPQTEKRAAPVLAAIEDAKDRTKDLLPLLGRLGGPDALRIIRESLRDSDLRAAALAGISNWPDVAANPDLLALAEKWKEPATRLMALQALIRINTAPGERTLDERFAALGVMKKAMALTTRDEERRATLEGLGNVRHVETLRFVLPYLDQPTLAQAACKGIVELAHSKMLREPNKAEFEKALDRVIALCKDKGLVERAKQYKEGR